MALFRGRNMLKILVAQVGYRAINRIPKSQCTVGGFGCFRMSHAITHNGVHENGVNGTASLANADTYIEQKDVEFLEDVFKVIMEEGVIRGTDANNKVVDFKFPKELSAIIDLKLSEEASEQTTLVDLCKKIFQYSVKTGHPHFINQIFAGLDVHGLAGSWITDTLNSSQYTYEVAPVFTLMEQEVMSNLIKIIGYENGDGLFCPGGSVSNMYGLNVGRYHHFPEIKTKGMQALPNICLFTSELSHYSIKKGVAWMGMGLDCVKTVPCDTRGRMIPKKLEEMVIQSKEEGFTPFLVNATSGTTVAGAFDPLDAIADIAEKHNLWMHVDACWGGGLLFSDQQRHKLNGVHRSDSVAWNAHKLLGAPLQCCVFVTKHKDLLRRAHSANAQYLFQQDKFYDVSYDTGDMSIQCGRKVDVLKLWMMWKAKGSSGFAADVNHLLSLADYFTQKIKTIEGFRMVYPEPECTNICFWYIPKEFRSQEADSDEWWKRLAKVAPLIKERMIMKGSMMVGYNPEGSKVNFFRVLLSNTRLRQKDCDFMIAEIQRLGEDIPY